MMNKRTLIVFMSCALISGSAFAEDNAATLNVTGALNGSAATCTLALDHTVAELGQAALNMLPYIGSSSQDVKTQDAYFVNFLGEGCAQDNYGVKFIGATDESGQALANSLTGEGAAEGIAVNIYDAQGSIITPNTGVEQVYEEIYHRHFPFYLAMAKRADRDSRAGNVQASLTVEMVRL
ncbi:fimbrial protein [Cronobacter dublinensis]|nr:fimbrial protein [Cronobacter dublinensis]MDI7500437.1 fimbrial protein [Cronobacter dublinensis]MDI7505374.1 fimbrial protein [Cronobacter dublinensis]